MAKRPSKPKPKGGKSGSKPSTSVYPKSMFGLPFPTYRFEPGTDSGLMTLGLTGKERFAKPGTGQAESLYDAIMKAMHVNGLTVDDLLDPAMIEELTAWRKQMGLL
jgi:hypothetical protein